MQYNTIHDISVWLRTDSNPADVNRFRSHTGKDILFNLFGTYLYFELDQLDIIKVN